MADWPCRCGATTGSPDPPLIRTVRDSRLMGRFKACFARLKRLRTPVAVSIVPPRSTRWRVLPKLLDRWTLKEDTDVPDEKINEIEDKEIGRAHV